MKRTAFLGTVLLLAAIAASAQTNAKLALGKQIDLFNGKDLAGWTHHLTDPDVKMEDVWSVDGAEGILICKGNPIGYVRTTKEYSNYVLTLEWRFSPVTKQGGNSGVLLHVVGPDKVWPKSIEAQLMSGSAGDFWLIDEPKLSTPAERVDRDTPRHRLHTKPNEKPIGQWNSYEIICNRGTITLRINGEVVNEGTGASLLKGAIGLQSEGSEIHFRRIRLRPIVR